MSVFFLCLLFTAMDWTTEGAFIFTQKPAKTVYFMEGSNATIEWRYKVDSRKDEFDFVMWMVVADKVTTLLYENATGNVMLGPSIPAAYIGRVKKIGQATLFINNVNFNDSVSFRCQLFPKAGAESDDTVKLTVTGRASQLPLFHCAMPGESVTFTCNATAVPGGNFSWWRLNGESKQQLRDDGQRIHIISDTGSSVLVLKDIAHNASVYYECSATANPDQPNVAQKSYLEVKTTEPLQEDEKANPERNFSIDVGDNKVLCCPIKGYPPPFVTWEKNGTLLKKTVDKCLTISSAKDEDFGNYTCSATDGTRSSGPYTFSLMKKRTAVSDVSLDISDKSAQKAVMLNWLDVPGAQYFVVKITGNDIRDDVMCRVGEKRSLELHYNALVFKNAEKNPEETTVCVKVVALNNNDDVIAKTSTCREITIKSGQVTLSPSIMCFPLIVCASWKMW